MGNDRVDSPVVLPLDLHWRWFIGPLFEGFNQGDRNRGPDVQGRVKVQFDCGAARFRNDSERSPVAR